MHLVAITDTPYPAQHFALDVSPESITLTTAIDDPAGCAGETIHEGLAGLILRPCEPLQLPLSLLRQNQQWRDGALWAVMQRMPDFSPYGVTNVLADSLASRRPYWANGAFMNVMSAVSFAMPFASATFADAAFRVTLAPGARLCANIPFTTVPIAELIERRVEDFPLLTLEGADTIRAGEVSTFTVRASRDGAAVPFPVGIELEVGNGYLAKTRVNTADSASFTVRALDLVAGDSIKIKAGLRYYRAMVEKVVEVV